MGDIPEHNQPLLVKVPFTAFLRVGETEFDVQRAEVVYQADNVAIASIMLNVGRPLRPGGGGVPQVTAQQLEILKDDVLAELVVETNSEFGPGGETNGELPGMPDGVVFTGYIQTPGPHTVSSDGSSLGYQVTLMHRDSADLDTGAPATWPYVPSTGFDFQLPVRVDNEVFGQVYGALSGESALTVSNLDEVGFLGIFRQFLALTAQGADEGSTVSQLATFPECGQGISPNETALSVINNINNNNTVGEVIENPLTLRQAVLSEYMTQHLASRLNNDLRLMSFHEQIQVMGQDLFFNTIPLADGSLIIRPVAAFSPEPLKTISGFEIFNFQPSGIPNRRLFGVLLLGHIHGYNTSVSDQAIGCYTISAEVPPKGIIQSMQAPSWLTPGRQAQGLQPVETLKRSVATTRPDAPGEQVNLSELSDSGVNEDSGFRTAREYTRRLRYGSSKASFSTYLRTDIAPMSEVRVRAPGYFGSDVVILGRVQSCIIRLDANARTAQTDFNLAYVRSEQDHNQLIENEDAALEHPVFQSNWPGGPLGPVKGDPVTDVGEFLDRISPEGINFT